MFLFGRFETQNIANNEQFSALSAHARSFQQHAIITVSL